MSGDGGEMGRMLEAFVRRRCDELEMSLAELCRSAGVSRQTLYDCWAVDRYPSTQTLVALSWRLRVHPLRLLELVFWQTPLPPDSTGYRPGDRSAFVSDPTHPDGEWVMAGERFTKVWRLQNAGRVPWEGRSLSCQDEDVVVYSRREAEPLKLAPPLTPEATCVPVPDTPPGETVDIAATFLAPDAPGTVLSYWKMTDADGRICFPEARGVWVRVTVIAPTMAAGSSDTDAP